MYPLFQQEPIVLDLPDAEIIYYPHFMDTIEADAIFSELKNTIPWQQDEIRVFGKIHQQPRLTALYGNKDKTYSYSNIKMSPNPWIPILEKIKLKIEKVCPTEFTTVLLNYYRDGKDSNGWHADDEKELPCPCPVRRRELQNILRLWVVSNQLLSLFYPIEFGGWELFPHWRIAYFSAGHQR